MGSRISSTVTHTVVLGSGGYASPLIVTGNGVVAPVNAGAIGVIAHAKGVTLHNHGTITGAAGSYGNNTNGGAGGIGVEFTRGGFLGNTGTIAGGAGGSTTGTYVNGGAGGIGVDFTSGGTIHNAGSITGGVGGLGGYAGYGGDGGAGVDITGGLLSNSGTIHGGTSGSNAGGIGGSGNGGAGVVVAGAGTLTNAGNIAGGTVGPGSYPYYGQGNSGVGVDLAAGGKIINAGTITGGADGGLGVALLSGGTLVNRGVISGGSGYLGGGGLFSQSGTIVNTGTIEGGASGQSFYREGSPPNVGPGVLMDSGTLLNTGAITGVNGIYAFYYRATIGGAGIDLAAQGTVFNHGAVTGGVGGGSSDDNAGQGGIGVDIAGGGSLSNSGLVAGGAGGYSKYGFGGVGGTGVVVATGGKLTNSGTAAGGAAGMSYFNTSHVGATGGIGVDLRAGGTVTNSGAVTGGSGSGGGANIQYGGNGGAGVYIAGGTLTNSGTIAGGAGGIGTISNGLAGDAIQFGTLAATLVIDPSAKFVGVVAANASVNDTLALAGTTAGTLTGLGSAFTGFSTLVEHAGADWTLGGINALAAGTEIQDAGYLANAGRLSDAGTLTVAASGQFQASGNSRAHIAAIDLRGGAISVASAASLVVGGGQGSGPSGILEIQAGAALIGYGTLANEVIDNGTISASGGTLTLASHTSGTGTIEIGGHSTLSEQGGVDVAILKFDSGSHETLAIGQNTTVSSTISGFASSDTIDIPVVANTLAFLNGTLTLEQGSTVVETLTFAGDYTSANFALSADGHGGTDISFAAGSASMAEFAPQGPMSGYGAGGGFGSADWATHAAALPAYEERFGMVHAHPT